MINAGDKGQQNPSMNLAIESFIAAHDRYLALDEARCDCTSPQQRERLHIEIMRAYLEVQQQARVITGLSDKAGMHFASTN